MFVISSFIFIILCKQCPPEGDLAYVSPRGSLAEVVQGDQKESVLVTSMTKSLEERCIFPVRLGFGSVNSISREAVVPSSTFGAKPASLASSDKKDHPIQKAITEGADPSDTMGTKPFHWRLSHGKDCPIFEDLDSVDHMVKHFKSRRDALSHLSII